MTVLRLGLVAADAAAVEQVRPDDEVAIVVLRSTLLEAPRAGAARTLAERLHARVPGAEIVPYAWHFVTHAMDDPLPGRGTRQIDGDPARTGHLADTPEVEEAWAATLRVMSAFGASHVVLRTPAGLAPGVRGRNRLAKFAERRRTEPVQLIWEAEGLWEPQERDALAARLGLSVFAPPPPDGPIAFENRWLVWGVGGSPAELRAGHAEVLVDEIADTSEPVTLLFAGSSGIRNLRRFRRTWRDLA